MGLEGAVSTAYFGCLSGLVPPEVAFDGRSRRPPKDLANGRPLLRLRDPAGRVHGALLAAGLAPTLGVLHASTDRRRSLSLDLQRGGPVWPAALEGWGYRLQESVIQLRLEPAELDEMRQQITETINQADDVIHLYPLCDSCLARSEVHGTSPALDDAGLYRGVW
ncbi:CRISPR-associated endonuclease Cas2 [Actinomyces oris]|nr:CRISPR-associated endonuclease Cas2 [Actinomyces oris]